MLSFLLIPLTCVTAEVILGAPPPSSGDYTKCASAVDKKHEIWDVSKYQCKAFAPKSGAWCCEQCNEKEEHVCPPKDVDGCDCEKVAPKPKVMCPADFPLCKSDYSICASHVAGNHKNMHCDEDYNFVMCPSTFPYCYHDGYCVLQECAHGFNDICTHWEDNVTQITLKERIIGKDGKQNCNQHYSPNNYKERKNTNLDSELPQSNKPNLLDLGECKPGAYDDPVIYCKKECEKDFRCGGFTIHPAYKTGERQIMFKRMHIPDGSSPFEREEYFRTRDGFTTYYVKPRMPEPTTRELISELFA